MKEDKVTPVFQEKYQRALPEGYTVATELMC